MWKLELYLDINNNDSLDVGDTYVANTFTDGDTGNYCFDDITPAEYVVFEIQPNNYNSVSDFDMNPPVPLTRMVRLVLNDPDNEIAVTLMPNETDSDNDFIEDPIAGSISGYVSDDAGTPLAGVEILLYNDTNFDGSPDGGCHCIRQLQMLWATIYLAGVVPGFYVVVETTPLYYSNISDYDHTTTPPDTDGNDTAQGPDDNIPVRCTSG